jgi:predicted aspartyl protease
MRDPKKALVLVLMVSTLLADDSAQPEIKSLYDARRWAELYRAVQGRQAPALYRGAVAAVFGDDRRAESILRSVISSAPHSKEAYEAYEWLAHIYFRNGEYRRFVTDMEARWAGFPNKSEQQNERTAVAGFRGLPDQSAGKPRHSTLPHEPGKTFIPISINHSPATYFFDTGAWLNCMSESEAKRLGLTIHEADGTLGTGTGARVGFRTAVAGDVTVGDSHFRNVSFAIFGDDQEPWSELADGRRGLIGIPILLGLRTLRWSRESTLEIGGKSGPAKPDRSNLFFDDDHLVVSGELGRRRILATLDTGAVTTDLYQAFANEFALLIAAGKKDTTEVRGVGNAESFDSITLPELKFSLGGLDVALSPAHVLLKQIGAKCCIGNFGMDLLKQGSAFTIDFGAMRLDLEPNP